MASQLTKPPVAKLNETELSVAVSAAKEAVSANLSEAQRT